MSGSYRIEALHADHDRTGFVSGSDALDHYFRETASQDVRRRASACYVALDAETSEVAGFYTLAAAGIPLGDMPASMVKKLPRYPFVPVARLGRLAVSNRFHGQGLGAALLWDAIERALRSEVAVFALAVDAKDDTAAAFYAHHGFVSFGTQPRQFILPLASFVKKN